MRSTGLNGALAVIALAAVAATCSGTTEKAGTTAPRAITFNRDIAPILFDNCASCHRPIDNAPKPVATAGSPDDPICVAGAPFSVLDYDAVRRHARAIS